MKKIEAFIKPEKLEDIKELLCSFNINGLSIHEIMGCGNQKGWKDYVRDFKLDYNFRPKIKIEMIVLDDQVESIVEKICDTAYTGQVGDGKIFISEIQDAIRIRTRERGICALT